MNSFFDEVSFLLCEFHLLAKLLEFEDILSSSSIHKIFFLSRKYSLVNLT